MESNVRVGVRVRPLLPSEQAQGGAEIVKFLAERQIGVGNRTFTFDYVFPPAISQADLYASTAGGMLQSFLEGYNVTILAYGQTGSGKTFTMGSEAGHVNPCNTTMQGLIPRFLDDLFKHLWDSTGDGKLLASAVSTSFLEIKGEEIFDLLEESDASKQVSLQVREDGKNIVVVGLRQVAVKNRQEAMNVLRKGTMNRTTAATLMNVSSSRSHAVFTVVLQQTVRSSPEFEGDKAGGQEDIEGEQIISKLTFVDLAGSERLKKTRAEGERMREGIQINVGLLALGNVVNALGDEERLALGKKIHVPYRQSKLTRLLQDALGGNSRTLVLAESNASETLSTLHYANRARNIKNKPVKNTDSVKEELRCLRHTTNFLKSELVRLRLGNGDAVASDMNESELMERPGVADFLQSVAERLDAHLKRVGIKDIQAPKLLSKPLAPLTPLSQSRIQDQGQADAPPSCGPEPVVDIREVELEEGTCRRSLSEELERVVMGNPEEEMAWLDKLQELERQHKADEQEQQASEERDMQELNFVEDEIEEKEELLSKLRQTLGTYHEMRNRYEKLVKDLDGLEHEKNQLQCQLELAQAQERKAGREEASGPQVNQLKEKLKNVNAELDRLRLQKKEQETQGLLAERQRAKLAELEASVRDLKQKKVQMIRKQKEEAVRHRESLEQKRRMLEALSRNDRKLKIKMGQLERQNKMKEIALEKSHQMKMVVEEKYKKAEAHLMKLLSMNRRDHDVTRRGKSFHVKGKGKDVEARGPTRESSAVMAATNEKVATSWFLLKTLVAGRVDDMSARILYEQKLREYESVLAELRGAMEAVKEMHENESIEELEATAVRSEAEARWVELDLKAEIILASLRELKSKLRDTHEGVATASKDVVNDLRPEEMRGVLTKAMEDLVEARSKVWELEHSVKCKSFSEKGLLGEKRDLERRLSEVGRTFQRKLAQLESKHQQDLVLLAKTGGDGWVARAEDEASADDIDEAAKRQMSALARQNEELLERCLSLEQRVKNAEAEADKANANSLELNERLTALSSLGATLKPEIAQGIQDLQGLWVELGVDHEEIQHRLAKLSTAAQDTCWRYLEETKGLKAAVWSDMDRDIGQLMKFLAALGEDTRLPPDLDAMPLMMRKSVLGEKRQDAEERWRKRLKELRDLLSEGEQLQESLGLTEEEKSFELADLMMNQSVEDVQLLEPRKMSEDRVEGWRASIKALKILRAQRRAEMTSIQSDCRSLSMAMAMGPEDLQAVLEKASRRERRATKSITAVPTVLDRALIAKLAMLYSYAGDGEPIQASEYDLSLATVHVVQSCIVRRVLQQCKTCRQEVIATLKKMVLMLGDFFEGQPGLDFLASKLRQALKRQESASSQQSESVGREWVLMLKGELLDAAEVLTKSLAGLRDKLQSLKDEMGWSGEEWEEAVVWPETGGKVFQEMADCLRALAALPAVSEDLEGWGQYLQAVGGILPHLDGDSKQIVTLTAVVKRLELRKQSRETILHLNQEFVELEESTRRFEVEVSSNSKRLTSRAGNSTHLLKEEKTRKELKARYNKLLKDIRSELDKWYKREGRPFDVKLLSHDIQVSMVVAQGSDNRDWVEGRTELMHLHTAARTSGGSSRGSSPTQSIVGQHPGPPEEPPKPGPQQRSSRSPRQPEADGVPAVRGNPFQSICVGTGNDRLTPDSEWMQEGDDLHLTPGVTTTSRKQQLQSLSDEENSPKNIIK